jgi:hypothetical protein
MHFLMSEGIGVLDRRQESRVAGAQSGSLSSGDIWLGERDAVYSAVDA